MQFVSNTPFHGTWATCSPASRPRGAAAGRPDTVPERLSSGPRGAHVSWPSPRAQGPERGRKAVEGRKSPADSLGRPLLTLSCRHFPWWAGGSGRARKRSGILEKSIGQRGSRGREGRRGADTPQAVSRDPARTLGLRSSTDDTRGDTGASADREEFQLPE